MTSFQTGVTPQRRAAARYIAKVRRELQRALVDAHRESGLTQSEIARTIDVHRSVITRELKGHKDISNGRVGELAWAMGYEPHFSLVRAEKKAGSNVKAEIPQIRNETARSNSAQVQVLSVEYENA